MNNYIFISALACEYFRSYGPPGDEWLEAPATNEVSLPQWRSDAGDVIVVTRQDLASLQSGIFFVIEFGEGGALAGVKKERRRDAFNRVLRVFQSTADSKMPVPALWKPFNYDSKITIQSASRVSGDSSRLLIDRLVVGQVGAICTGVVSPAVEFKTKFPDPVDRNEINRRLYDCQSLVDRTWQPNETDCFELEESNRVLGFGASLQAWYDSRLTTSQRNFVDQELTRSLRVRGPAGSGKTVALVVKLLRHLLGSQFTEKPQRYAFITHSQATVDLARSMIRGMLSDEEYARVMGDDGPLYIGTLYSRAYRTLGAELRGLEPLSLDGVEGRNMQAEMLRSVVVAYRAKDWATRRGGVTEGFARSLESITEESEVTAPFIVEVLLEFACVLEPGGFARSRSKRDEYISKSHRDVWRMRLSTEDERRVILDLYGDFRAQMRSVDAMTVDQLIADFDRFLDSNSWEMTRSEDGFDAIFVDELHLMNRLERMLISSLVRDASASPIIVMAEDVKQDVRRIGQGLQQWQRDLPDMKSFKFDEVFRYTPQINDLMTHIDSFAPAAELAEDWPHYQQRSAMPPGDKPTLTLVKTIKDQYEAVFTLASRSAKKRKSGRSVAVLCCDYDTFQTYLKAGAYRDLFVPVAAREDIGTIPSKGVRFVLSMPEFVAGLQFDEVYLLDVSRLVLFAEEGAGAMDKRRGLATLYLGGSRAMTKLNLYSVSDAGGVPNLIEKAIELGICQEA
ncbi:UvrD-helicase domain-containing protein [Xanthomonas sp. WHRI 6106]|uniref:UvrD-helicase domain-containing protein n=1 Tax=Xanthomonas sp. WHRI 6106 TaxID=3161566 RepID=UPI0032E8AE16